MSGPDEVESTAAAAAATGGSNHHQQQQQQQDDQQQQAACARAAKRAKLQDEEDEEESLGSGEHDDEDEEEEDGLERPAAEAITLRLLEGGGGAGQGGGWEFAPEFTHQLFEGEEVPPGYPDLSVRLTLGGRTAAWSVDINYDEEAGRREKAEMAAHAPLDAAAADDSRATAAATTTTTAAETPVLSSNGGDDVPLLRCLMPAVPPSEGAACVINGRRGRLYAEKGFVPHAQPEDGGAAEGTVAALPFGAELGSYTVEEGDEESAEFVLLHALPSAIGQPDPGSSSSSSATAAGASDHQQEDHEAAARFRAVANFHRRVQKLAPWFIENGDDVDPEAGEWELLYLVQRPPRQHQHQEQQHHHHRDATLAGYLTIYAFNNPLKGKGLRICQALVLPPFQRQGHGQRLLRAAYALARERDVVFEVTVEDPCPGFAMLRAVTDTQDLLALCQADPAVLGPLLSDAQRFDCLEKGDIGRVQAALKLTKNQVVLAYEALKLRQAPEDGDAGLHTKYRLMIKRRRAREVQGEYVGRKAEMQAHLDKFYRERLAECAEILRRAKLAPQIQVDGASE